MSPSQLRIDKLHLENFRCFEVIDVSFEKDLTVFFAENGGGKTALLTALSMALDFLLPRQTKELAIHEKRDVRRRTMSGEREPTGECKIVCHAGIGATNEVEWGVSISAQSLRRQKLGLEEAADAIEQVRQPGERWPLFGFYGTDRFANKRKPGPTTRVVQERLNGYIGCLSPAHTDGPLLDWLLHQVVSDFGRHQRGEAERRLDRGVLEAIERAIPELLKDLWFDPALGLPAARFADGSEATWTELSDGFHVTMGLVGDIARRAVILNGQDGADAPKLIEGVVLIDEIDMHLHTSWQRTVLDGLRRAFPKLQFIVTTHSPQVLSSAENRQARLLQGNQVRTQDVFVEGRDTNAILRLMRAGERDESGIADKKRLYELIESNDLSGARSFLEKTLRSKWGSNDPEFIRAEGFLKEAEADGGE